MAQRICTAEGCERVHDARGLCKTHYLRAKKAGTLPPLVVRVRPTKPCGWCGKDFTRPTDYSDKMWSGRLYCSRACSGRAASAQMQDRGAEAHHLWRGDQATEWSARDRARRAMPVLPACADCGGVARDRHHIDEDPWNNDLSNLVALCRPCHLARHGGCWKPRKGQR